MKHLDVAIIGGGLAGLAAATRLARLGKRCVVFERSEELGGRGRTTRESGYAFNVGPHALYRKREAERFLTELSIPIPGARVSGSNAYGLLGDELHALPGGFVSLLTTTALDLSGKLEMARLMTELRMLDPKSLAGISAADWLAKIRDEGARRVVAGITRVATYTAALDQLSAEVAAMQLKSAAFDGVRYIDGGWSSLVDGLLEAAKASGAEVRTGAKVERISIREGRVAGVVVEGEELAADAVLIAAGGPQAAAKLSGSESLARCAERSVPIKAAVLDVALDARLNPKVKFACGLDRAVYFSVHSDSARVAPEGGSMVSSAIYLRPDDERSAAELELELEELLDRLQPDWKRHLVRKQFLPAITVAYALVGPEKGLAGRHPVAVPDVGGLFVAGDWVGDSGFLSDASLASAKEAARAISTRTAQRAA